MVEVDPLPTSERRMVVGIRKKFVYPHYVYVIHIRSTEYDKTRDVNRKAQVTPYEDTTKYMIN